MNAYQAWNSTKENTWRNADCKCFLLSLESSKASLAQKIGFIKRRRSQHQKPAELIKAQNWESQRSSCCLDFLLLERVDSNWKISFEEALDIAEKTELSSHFWDISKADGESSSLKQNGLVGSIHCSAELSEVKEKAPKISEEVNSRRENKSASQSPIQSHSNWTKS